MDTLSFAILGIIVLLAVYLIVIYNSIVSLKNNRKQAFSDIDVQLKLRYDLVPNLVETVKGYATHEKELFEKIALARNNALSASSISEKVDADNMFSRSLKSLFAVAEAYPDLKANQNFLSLQNELSDIENKLAASRRFFNNATKEYNSVIMQFPNVLLAQLLGMKEENYFDLGAESEVVSKNIEIKM